MNTHNFHAIESFLSSVKDLENQLQREKAAHHETKQQLVKLHQYIENKARQFESKTQEYAIDEAKTKNALGEYQKREKDLTDRLYAYASEFKKTRLELSRYQDAWSEILLREKEAKDIILAGDQYRKQIGELSQKLADTTEDLKQSKKKMEQAERHSESYQKELQAALVRLHSSESRFNEISKELSAYTSNKKNWDQQVVELEKTIKERYDWQLVKEKEALKSDFQKELALFKADSEQQVLLKIEKVEKEAQNKATNAIELAKELSKKSVDELQTQLNICQEKAQKYEKESFRLLQLLEESDCQLQSFKTKLNQSQLQLDTLKEQQIAELSQQKSAFENQIDTLQKTLHAATQKSKLESERISLEWTQKYSERMEECDRLSHQLAAESEKNRKINASIRELENQVSAYKKSQLFDEETFRDQIKHLTNQLCDAQVKFTILTNTEHSRCEQLIQKLKKRYLGNALPTNAHERDAQYISILEDALDYQTERNRVLSQSFELVHLAQGTTHSNGDSPFLNN